MTYITVGLGNPGDKYENTRHNVGRMFVTHLNKNYDFSDWRKDGKINALVSSGFVEGREMMLLLPQTFMNKSGSSVRNVLNNKEDIKKLIVVHDDLDLPIGSFKSSFNKGSAGQKGVDSIIKELGTKEFLRLRIGISPVTIFGKMKKPKGENSVTRFILKQFSNGEMKKIEKVFVELEESVKSIISNK